MQARGLAQWQAAALAGVDAETVARAQRGRPLHGRVAERLAPVVGIPAHELRRGWRR
jgi:hypothetical protein